MTAAEVALEGVRDGMTLGLGTGRAATAFISALGERVAAGLRIRGVPTSDASADLAWHLGIPLVTLDDVTDRSWRNRKWVAGLRSLYETDSSPAAVLLDKGKGETFSFMVGADTQNSRDLSALTRFLEVAAEGRDARGQGREADQADRRGRHAVQRELRDARRGPCPEVTDL